MKIAELNWKIILLQTEMYSFYNVRDAVDDFTGRSKIINIIHHHFIDAKGKFKVQIIAAGGGLGKTQLILQYVYKFKQEYGISYNPRVYWISAENKTTAIADIKSLHKN